MIENNIIFILKTLNEEGYIRVESTYEEIKELLREFNLEEINTENFNVEVY
jgi:hypothetical protein